MSVRKLGNYLIIHNCNAITEFISHCVFDESQKRYPVYQTFSGNTIQFNMTRIFCSEAIIHWRSENRGARPLSDIRLEKRMRYIMKSFLNKRNELTFIPDSPLITTILLLSFEDCDGHGVGIISSYLTPEIRSVEILVYNSNNHVEKCAWLELLWIVTY